MFIRLFDCVVYVYYIAIDFLSTFAIDKCWNLQKLMELLYLFSVLSVFMYFEVLLLGEYTFMIFMSSWSIIQEQWENIKPFNICVTGILGREEREWGREISKEIMAQNLQNQ